MPFWVRLMGDDAVVTIHDLAKQAMAPITTDYSPGDVAQAILRLTYAVLALALATAAKKDAL